MSTFTILPAQARERFAYIDLTSSTPDEIAVNGTHYPLIDLSEDIEKSAVICGICRDLTVAECSGVDHMVCFQCRGAVCRPCAELIQAEAIRLKRFAGRLLNKALSTCPFCRVVWNIYSFRASIRIKKVEEEEAMEELTNRKKFSHYEPVGEGGLNAAAEAFFEQMDEDNYMDFEGNDQVFQHLNEFIR